MSKKIVVCMLYDSDNISTILQSVKSITDGQVIVTDIVIADYNALPLPSSLKKKEKVSIIKTLNYGVLSSLVAAINKHGTSDSVNYILADGQVIYMENMVSYYLKSTQELTEGLKSKIPAGDAEGFKGSVFGLSGLLFIENKQITLQTELQELLTLDEPAKNLKRSQIGYTRDNSTVDLLEISGSMYFTGPQIDNLKDSLRQETYTRITGAVFLANYFAKKGIYRTQICNLDNNKYIMQQFNLFQKAVKLNMNDYYLEINRIYKEDMFYLWTV